MKLHLPSDLRHAVLACITTLCGIAATSTTGTLAIGAATVALASTALAETYTPDSTTHTISNTLQSGDVIELSGNSIGTSSTPATLSFATDNTGVTLDVTSGTCTWNVTSNSYGADSVTDDDTTNDNAGVSAVNVSSDATLNVYNNNLRYPAFNKKSGAVLNITLDTGATLRSKCQIFGWANDSFNVYTPGNRTLTMGSGSTWEIEMVAEANEWLNNTTVIMNNATIRLADGKSLMFERNSSAIKTATGASGMSLITGGGANGKLKVGGGSPSRATINEYSGILFEIQRGVFTLNETNTADLRIESALQNGDLRDGIKYGNLLKSGSGVLELTNANSDYSDSVFVTAGTLKLGGENGQAGSGTITVDSGATLELAHSQESRATNHIALSADATLKVTGSQEIIVADSSLLGTVALSHTLLNTAAITLGETTIFDLRNWNINKTGATPITLISGGTVSGYEHLSAANIDGWDGGTAVFSWANGALLLASETISSTNVYWDPTSTDTVWTDTTQFNNGSDGTGSSTTAGSNTIVFNTGTETTLTLGSDIANAVHITSNTPTQPDAVPTGSTLQLTMESYNLTGEVTVDAGSTLEIKDNTAFSVSDHFNKPGWNGSGKVILKGKTGNNANHNGHISLTNFNGTVQVSGKFNLGSSEIGSNGTWHLKSGEAWSDANATIANKVIVDDFVLRPNNKYIFTGVVKGTSVTIGHTDNDSTVQFSNAASNISKVNVVNGTVEYNGTATSGNTLFTGNTHLSDGTNMVLTPSGTTNATAASEARQYKGAVYVNGSTITQLGDVLQKITFTDGSTYITEGLHFGNEANSLKFGKLVVNWDKNHFIGGLHGYGTLFITRNNQNSGTDHGRYIALTGSSKFTGGLNISNNMTHQNAADYAFGMMVLGETNSATALQNTVVNFDPTAAKKNALVFTTSESIVDKAQFTGDNFQKAANGKLAGLSGGKGAVYANELTLGGNRECTYNGELFIEKLIVDRTGKQTLAGAANYRYNMEVDVQNGTLAFSGNADVTALTITSTLEVNGGDVTIGSTAGSSGTLKATAGSVTLKEGTHVLGTLDLSNGGASTATVTVQSGGSLQASTLRSSQHSSIALEDGASFIASDAVTIGGEASATDADKTKVQATAAADYSIGSEQYTISNATVTVSTNATTDTTIANTLLGSALINDGNVTVTATNSGNNLTKIEANGGNINLQNVGASTPEELHSLVIGAGKTVGAHTDASSVESVENEATLTVSDVATFGQGATLNANLNLSSSVKLTLNGALQMGSSLTLHSGMTLAGEKLAELSALTFGHTVELFTGVDTLVLDSTSYTMSTDTLSEADAIDLHTYFTNVQAGSYYLGYNPQGVVYAGRSVPEPATTTLGLLALAGLCARRRRK